MALVCWLGFVASATPLRAQDAKAPATILPPTGAELVRLEVVVKEGGRQRTGLRREDFAVFEDGTLQTIVQFQAFARADDTAAPDAPAAVAAEDVARADVVQLPARYIVLVIDDVHMEFESLVRLRKALERYLAEDLRAEDQVALVTTSGALALSQDFTSDRAILRQTLSRLSALGRRPDWTNVHISEYQAEMIEAGDPLALAAAVQEILAGSFFEDRRSAEREARSRDEAGTLPRVPGGARRHQRAAGEHVAASRGPRSHPGSALARRPVPDEGCGKGEGGGSTVSGGCHPHPVQAFPRFGRAEQMYVQLFAYNPKRDARGAIDLVSQAAVVKGDVVLATAAPEPMVEDAPGSPFGHLSRIRLDRRASTSCGSP